jgi:hypothetical protein
MDDRSALRIRDVRDTPAHDEKWVGDGDRMTCRFDKVSRRAFVRTMGAGAAAGLFARTAAAAEDKILQNLIEQNQGGAFSQGFDSASRTITMPKASLPTLSPSTAQTTEQAIARYDEIVANGGWPAVPPVERLRLGNRHPRVVALRRRLVVSGDPSTACCAKACCRRSTCRPRCASPSSRSIWCACAP